MLFTEKAKEAALILGNATIEDIYLRFEKYLSKLDGSILINPTKRFSSKSVNSYNGIFFGIVNLAQICITEYDDYRTIFNEAPVDTNMLIPFTNMKTECSDINWLLKEIQLGQNEGMGCIYLFLDESENIWGAWDETVYKVASSIDEFLLEIASGLSAGYPEHYPVFLE